MTFSLREFIKNANFGISLIVFALAIGIAAITLPIFGNKALIVKSGSMQPTIGVGDLIAVKNQPGLVVPQNVPINKYSEGDIIAFKDGGNPKIVTTHRIVSFEVKDNKILYQTKGDANNSLDGKLVAEENIVGRADYSIKGLGKIFAFTKTRAGLMTMIIFPALMVIFIEAVTLIREFKKRESNTPSINFSTAAVTKAAVPVFAAAFMFTTTFAYFSNSGQSTNNTFVANIPAPPIATTLVMNELLPHSTCSSGNTEGQFLELWNGTAGTVNLKDFKLFDGTNTIAISNSVANLASHAFAILAKSNGVINACLGDIHGAITPNLGGQVDMSATTLQLLDAGNVVIDTIKWNLVNPTLPTNQSVERNPTGLDSALGILFAASDFVTRTTPRPGQ